MGIEHEEYVRTCMYNTCIVHLLFLKRLFYHIFVKCTENESVLKNTYKHVGYAKLLTRLESREIHL